LLFIVNEFTAFFSLSVELIGFVSAQMFQILT
jgi:hypothetical protein